MCPQEARVLLATHSLKRFARAVLRRRSQRVLNMVSKSQGAMDPFVFVRLAAAR